MIDGIVCDGASTNRKMWSDLSINGAQDGMKNYFDHVIIIADHNRSVLFIVKTYFTILYRI